ncbi:uncharacterized protein LOC141673363 [Apium graveolens]|uniref:uncharacterized protein LOC141673363 n=1 Tax=Apium graveolens TaxID=4045 RepID=UPI003D7A5417
MEASKIEMSKTKEVVGLSYPILTRGNYTTWAIKMRVFMQAHGVWDAIEPKDLKATVEERKDKIAFAAVYQGIPEDLLLSIAEKTTTREAWEAIKTMCLGTDRVKKANVQTLKAKFESLKMKDTEQLDEFCIKLNRLVANIRALGESIDEGYVVKKLPRAVPKKFLQIASTIEQFGDLDTMSVEEAVGSLKAHEERLKGQGEHSRGQQLLLTEEGWLKKEKEEGQLLFTREEWLRRSSLKSKGNGSDFKTKEENREQRLEANLAQALDDEPALLMVEYRGDKVLLNESRVKPKLRTEVEDKQGGSDVWYLDNGASNHMTGEKSKFRELDEKVIGQVRFGDGSTVDIRGKGSIFFKCKDGEERMFKDVYFIPSLCNNILSLGQLSEEGNRVVIHGDFLWVYDKIERLLMKVKRSGNKPYRVVAKTVDSSCLVSKEEEEAWLWNSRLGHVNFQALNLMTRNKMVDGVPKIIQPREVCTGCLMAKQSKKSFPAQSSF